MAHTTPTTTTPEIAADQNARIRAAISGIRDVLPLCNDRWAETLASLVLLDGDDAGDTLADLADRASTYADAMAGLSTSIADTRDIG